MVHTKLDKQLIANFFERKNMTVKYTAALEKKTNSPENMRAPY
jgi:hypothetical protein